MTYTIVRIPSKLADVKDIEPQLPAPPKEPNVPVLTKNNEPIPTPKQIGSSAGKRILLVLFHWFYPCFCILGGIPREGANNFYLIWFFIVILFTIRVIVVYNRDSEKSKNNYEYELRAYQKRSFELEKNHEQQLKNYQKEYEIYLEKIKIYKRDMIAFKANFTINYLKEVLKETSKPILHQYEDMLTGASENYFFKKLTQTFGKNILKGYTIPFNGMWESSYLPDIVFYDETTGLCIDIEIDEPYVGSTGEAIHFLNNKHDEQRNRTFLRENWLVIRFAEEQVVKYPIECCNFIKKIIQDVTLDIISYNDINKDVAGLPKIKQWTKDDAQKLAFTRYRNSYLPKNLIEKSFLEDKT